MADIRRGFTLIELMVASLIVAFVLGSVALSVGQLGRARNTSKLRFDAFLRADSAVNVIRSNVAAISRSDDLFYCRLLLLDDTAHRGREEFDRDELLIFNTRLKPTRNIDFAGEGYEHETQFRIADDDFGPVLWQRTDAFPDEYPGAGGKAQPAVEGILGLTLQVYDGANWYDEWDSDISGLPQALSVIILSSGHRDDSDVYTAPRAFLRTVIPIDRVLPPKVKEEEDEEAGTDPNAAGADIDGDGIPDVDVDGDGQPDPSSGLGNGGNGGGGGNRPPPGGGGRPGGDNGGGGGNGGGGRPPPTKPSQPSKPTSGGGGMQ
ncbi:MAG TPA: prepilin-type N-terminal cleavage/methylation domain-containing protein [Phycisphaerales bacterium]|nr:prepilin-type N-terminal cleavage/methylation domain-containing protein [Phycisphaerales bacterium]